MAIPSMSVCFCRHRRFFPLELSDRAMLLTIVSGVLTAVILILMGEPFPGSLGGLIVSAIPFCIGLWNGRQRAEVH